MRAVIHILRHVPSSFEYLLIATDSKYIGDSMQGSVFRWRDTHWCSEKPNAKCQSVAGAPGSPRGLK